MISYHKILLKPVVNEKSLRLATEENKYTFIVDISSNKNLIQEAVEKLFDVSVLKVNIMNRKGKSKRFRNIPGKQKNTKKAIIMLKEGQTIETFKNLK